MRTVKIRRMRMRFQAHNTELRKTGEGVWIEHPVIEHPFTLLGLCVRVVGLSRDEELLRLDHVALECRWYGEHQGIVPGSMLQETSLWKLPNPPEIPPGKSFGLRLKFDDGADADRVYRVRAMGLEKVDLGLEDIPETVEGEKHG